MDRRQGHLKNGLVPRRRLGPKAVSPFVGRDDELSRLELALELAVEGQGCTIVLAGQRGIGKTRLAREALNLAKSRGFAVLEGRAYPLGIGLAYAPILDAFGPLLRDFDSSRLATLVSGLTNLGRLFDGLGLPNPEPLGDPALEKTRLFEAMSRLLERLSCYSPVALFIDDLHWADPATLELLQYLARGLASERSLLLVTYSTEASDTSRGLRALVAPLLRDGLAEELVIPRLDPNAVDRLVQGILGGEAPGNLLALLETRASGTPLFVEALVTALLESGNLSRGATEKGGWHLNAEGARALPPSVSRLILERLERLAPVDRRVLDLIAVMGDSTTYFILRAASHLEEEPLVDALQRLRAGGLVAEETDGPDVAYSITHPLVQEVAYADLTEIARRRAHMAAIEAYDRWRPQDVDRLARHYDGAGPEADPNGALEALLAAGDRALAVYANDEAARHYSAALAIVREGRHGQGSGIPSPDRGGQLLPWLLERLGEVWERVGKIKAAVEAWNEALAEREGTGDALAAARLHYQLALAEWDRGRFETGDAHLRAGLVRLAAGTAGHEPCQELADLHFTRFHIFKRLGDVAGLAATVSELLSAVDLLVSPRAQSQADLATSIYCLWRGDLANAREHALLALRGGESFPEGQELGICWRAQAILVVIGMWLGDHRLTRYHAERGLAVAQRLGAPHMEVVFRLDLALAGLMAGAWDESLHWSTGAIALARRVGYPHHLACALAERAMILTLRGDLLEAEATISEARMAFGDPSKEGPADRHLFGLVDIAETALALERGQVGHALEIAKGFVRSPAVADASAGLITPFMAMGLMLLAEAQVAAANAESALETARDLGGLGLSETPFITALAYRAEGLARQGLGQPEAAVDCLARAHELFTALAMPFDAARSLLEQAISATAARPALAARVAEQSLATFERIGAQRYADRVRRLLRSLGVSPPATRRAHLGGAYVSARELEVAQLVTQGLTTPEIAERLTLGPRTVSSHLRRIYIRLGIRSRTALARLVIDAGLL